MNYIRSQLTQEELHVIKAILEGHIKNMSNSTYIHNAKWREWVLQANNKIQSLIDENLAFRDNL